jgi:hypothetical protein
LFSDFSTKVAIIISTDDSPEFQARRHTTLLKLQKLTRFDQIIDKNLSESDSIYQLCETSRINEISNDLGETQKALLLVIYIGHGM